MLLAEPIVDPNVAAFYVRHCIWRMVVCRPNPIPVSWWGRAFTYWATWPAPVGPDEARRVGLVLYAGEEFAARVAFYVNSLRSEAAERFQASRESSAA